MGIYINKGNGAFARARRSEYIDKSGLIAVVNKTLFTRDSYTCVTRSRRFGKSMAAEMLAAYYDKSCDSRSLFADLEIAQDPTFEEHLNKYAVIYLDISEFAKELGKRDIVTQMEKRLIADIKTAYPKVPVPKGGNLMDFLQRIVDATGDMFVFIIDEWDAILREAALRAGKNSEAIKDDFVNWLRSMFKSVRGMDVFACVYMTGILPIKKYKTESAMNNFQEYSVVTPGALAPFFGFTKEEVRMLAERHGMDFEDLEKWYDGYQIGDQKSMFNPNSVMTAIRNEWCDNYWGKTGAANAISSYINLNFEGLKDDVLRMIAGERCFVNPKGFNNDLSEIHSRDDVLTVLIHLGYLSYDRRAKECFVPNLEVLGEMENAIRDSSWKEVTRALEQSRLLLDATLRGDEQTVATLVEKTHLENASIIKYNNENAMACVLAIAYYFAHGDYIFHREYATGKGYADLVLQPRKHIDKPAIIVELKYNTAVDTAIDQIHERRYPEKVAEYKGDILLVGISYDKKAKTHQCKIERVNK